MRYLVLIALLAGCATPSATLSSQDRRPSLLDIATQPKPKPAPPLRLPDAPAPGPVWTNPDGTIGARK